MIEHWTFSEGKVIVGEQPTRWKFKIFANFGKQQFDNYRQSLLYGTGQRAKMTDSSGTTRWSYDRRGQLIAERVQIDTSVFFALGVQCGGLAELDALPGWEPGGIGRVDNDDVFAAAAAEQPGRDIHLCAEHDV